MLEILASEVGDVGRDLEKELRHDGRDAAEVAGTDRPLPGLGDSRDFDRGREIRRVEQACVGQIERVRALAREKRGIPLLSPGVPREVLSRPELQRVDEDRDNHETALPSRRAHQRQMPLVERSHRGNETDGLSDRAGLPNELPQRGKVSDGFHGRSCQLSAISSQLFRNDAVRPGRLKAES